MEKRKALAAISLNILVIDIVILISFAIGCFKIANYYVGLYSSLSLNVPFITHVSIFFFGRFILFAILFIGLISKEFLKNKTTTLIINGIFLILPAILTYVFGLIVDIPLKS